MAEFPSAWWNVKPDVCACSMRRALDMGTVIQIADLWSFWAVAMVASSFEWNDALSNGSLSSDFSSSGTVIFMEL